MRAMGGIINVSEVRLEGWGIEAGLRVDGIRK